MAIKDKQRVSENKLSNIIKNDYKIENIILTIIATLAAAFSMLIITGEITINDNVAIIGQFPVVFGWILFGISIIGLGLVVYPFVFSAFPEIKKTSWPSKKDYLLNVTRVFVFMALMTFFLIFFDYIVAQIAVFK